jgi:hypothetical protein
MVRAKLVAALGLVALFGIWVPAQATTIPVGSAAESEGLAEPVGYRQCYWSAGLWLCTYYDDYDDHAASGDGPVFGYYGAPGIYLSFGGIGGFRPEYRGHYRRGYSAGY